jgi:heme/copper-type cytochrome/quinol oxidase subunit 2
VQFSLRSDNVIHSVWGLRLHGKLDLVPGQENVAWFTADEPASIAASARGRSPNFLVRPCQ